MTDSRHGLKNKNMKVVLYMAMTVNGIIAKSDDDTSWISPIEWNSYSETVRSAGNVVMGHRTYGIITKQPEFSELKNVKVIIVSQRQFTTLAENHVIAKSPENALEILKDSETVIVAGGGKLNASFMQAGLIDEIFLDIEPTAIGQGIKLFGDTDFDAQLELIGTKHLWGCISLR